MVNSLNNLKTFIMSVHIPFYNESEHGLFFLLSKDTLNIVSDLGYISYSTAKLYSDNTTFICELRELYLLGTGYEHNYHVTVNTFSGLYGLEHPFYLQHFQS